MEPPKPYSNCSGPYIIVDSLDLSPKNSKA